MQNDLLIESIKEGLAKRQHGRVSYTVADDRTDFDAEQIARDLGVSVERRPGMWCFTNKEPDETSDR